MTPLLAAIGPSAYWYLTRATGVVALVLLSASVVLGILGPLRFTAGSRWPRFAIDTLHRDVSLLAIVLLVVHILTSVLDGFAPITVADAVIPFISPYRPLWLGLGALSFDLLLAVVITSLVRRRLGYEAWRVVHWLAYLSWPIAVLHGLGTGSDSKAGWALAITAACVLAVVVAVLVRIARSGRAEWRGLGIASALAVTLGIAIFTIVGPLRPGWARRAGTPASLLGHPVTVASVSPGAPAPAPAAAKPVTLKAPFTARLSGNISQTQLQQGEIVDLELQLGGGATGKLRVRLGGAPLGGGGLSMTGSQVDLLANGLPSVMQGQVTSLQGNDLVARVTGASEPALELHASLTIDGQSGAVTGRLFATPAGSG